MCELIYYLLINLLIIYYKLINFDQESRQIMDQKKFNLNLSYFACWSPVILFSGPLLHAIKY